MAIIVLNQTRRIQVTASKLDNAGRHVALPLVEGGDVGRDFARIVFQYPLNAGHPKVPVLLAARFDRVSVTLDEVLFPQIAREVNVLQGRKAGEGVMMSRKSTGVSLAGSDVSVDGRTSSSVGGWSGSASTSAKQTSSAGFGEEWYQVKS